MPHMPQSTKQRGDGMKVLVTGAAGFIGGHTVDLLLKRGDDVVAVDSLNEYYDRNFKLQTLRLLRETAKQPGAGQLTIILMDLCNHEAVRKLFENHKPDVLCHLAAQAGVRFSIQNPLSNVDTNIMATVRLYDMCREFGVSRLVIASSSSVYGTSSTAPFSEDQICNQPISPYAATKRASELFGYTYHHLYKMNITQLRFFTVYGPRGRPDMACFKFILAMDEGRKIDKYGDGSAVREFTFVSDIVDGVVAAIDKSGSNAWLVVNLGGGSTHTLNELIETIEKHVGKKAVINQMGDQPGDVPLTSADQTVASRELGFKPKVSLDEGVRRTVEWYEAFKKDPANKKYTPEEFQEVLKGLDVLSY
uniref:NAD(P)-binding domain-containing protein n=1 Tax=Chromera velia CCMP2878 TaxID=1169474 RepID=A0A0G4HR83_9ALVE|eukprot:Cvel_8059.t1-p1 / transcript=Cvel_8059.t1 / gene=Cvel_8059 / organism=Chromera_velia_CCMP2878 / gene_product=Protein CapI, putative / transcript_product=Protein CapI, putative / location=Cvel_scaffold436:28521-32813(-) / protein_length=362 / sequence_SO=supercontig / SO=protein_coding / is_pseudo=false